MIAVIVAIVVMMPRIANTGIIKLRMTENLENRVFYDSENDSEFDQLFENNKSDSNFLEKITSIAKLHKIFIEDDSQSNLTTTMILFCSGIIGYFGVRRR